MTTRFGDVVARSVYGTTGYLADEGDVASLRQQIEASLPILRRFRSVVVATNYADADRDALMAANARAWRGYLPDCQLLDSPLNRGHSIGTADLDNLLFDHCKAHGIRWLCKGANDVRLTEPLLNIPVTTADFYYLNAVSYDAIASRNLDLAPFTDDFFYPQTTFYAIDVNATDYLNDPGLLDRSWAFVRRTPDYNGRIWEYLPGWACEALLRQCVLRNGLSRCSLVSPEQWRALLELVVAHRITDCSFKGLDINGICHDCATAGVIATVR